jgi:hypothetical protein
VEDQARRRGYRINEEQPRAHVHEISQEGDDVVTGQYFFSFFAKKDITIKGLCYSGHVPWDEIFFCTREYAPDF